MRYIGDWGLGETGGVKKRGRDSRKVTKEERLNRLVN